MLSLKGNDLTNELDYVWIQQSRIYTDQTYNYTEEDYWYIEHIRKT
jgi:hypothetical protein